MLEHSNEVLLVLQNIPHTSNLRKRNNIFRPVFSEQPLEAPLEGGVSPINIGHNKSFLK